MYGVCVVGYWFRTEYCQGQLVGRSADGLYRSGIGFSALFFANSVKMAGTEIDGGESSMLSEEEERREGGLDWDWNEVVSRTRKESGRKRKKEQTGASGSDNDGIDVGGSGQNTGVTNMVVRFEEEGGVKKFDPLKLTQIIQRQVGEETVIKLLSSSFKEDKTRLSGDAALLMAELLKVFVQEAAVRSQKQAESEDCDQVDIEHFEKILPQLLLDF
ncbi:centromere protein X isoform X1 [Perca flavescens]|uniref:centromere protein X isoform X1 n=1 Tax=Perca flavescens TaxID=8167 RepID=UPI00106F08D2|nr:centromere protein X isoform X1 [Perca flavescens]